MALGGEARERHIDDVGVAEEPGAVRVGALHRFGHQEQRLRIALVREIVAFEDVEHLDQHDAAGGGRRHRDDVVAAIGAAHGRTFDRAIILEIVGGHDAAGGLHRIRDLFRDRPGVERPRPGLGDCFEGVGEIRLHQPLAGAERVPSGLRKISAEDGQRASRGRSLGSESAVSSVIAIPSRASAIAGAIKSASVNRPEPYFSAASARPATVPGTPMASAESRDFCGSALPSASRNDVALIACGAVSR